MRFARADAECPDRWVEAYADLSGRSVRLGVCIPEPSSSNLDTAISIQSAPGRVSHLTTQLVGDQGQTLTTIQTPVHLDCQATCTWRKSLRLDEAPTATRFLLRVYLQTGPQTWLMLGLNLPRKAGGEIKAEGWYTPSGLASAAILSPLPTSPVTTTLYLDADLSHGEQQPADAYRVLVNHIVLTSGRGSLRGVVRLDPSAWPTAETLTLETTVKRLAVGLVLPFTTKRPVPVIELQPGEYALIDCPRPPIIDGQFVRCPLPSPTPTPIPKPIPAPTAETTWPICADRVHSRWSISRNDMVLPTWHLPADAQAHCRFDHEHGSDPAQFVGAVDDVVLGYPAAAAHLDESHQGYKVYVINDDGHGLALFWVVHQGDVEAQFHSLELWVVRLSDRALLAHVAVLADFGRVLSACGPEPYAGRQFPAPGCNLEIWTADVHVGGMLTARPQFWCVPDCFGDRRMLAHPLMWLRNSSDRSGFTTDVYGRRADSGLEQYVLAGVRLNQRLEIEDWYAMLDPETGIFTRANWGTESVDFLPEQPQP